MRAGDHLRRIERPVRLRQRPGRQPQPHRRAVRLLHELQSVAQHDGEFVDMRRLEAREPVGGHADQRRVDRLVLPALGRQGQSGRSRNEQKARVLITGVEQRIEASIDERIVDRADRQNPRAGHGRRQTRRAQQQKQVLLGDAQFDVLPERRHAPTLRRGQLEIAEHVVARVTVEDPAPVHPGPEIGRHRHVRAGGHDVRGEFLQLALAAAQFGEDVAEAALRGHFAAGGFRHRQGGRNRNDRRAQRASLGGQLRRERRGGEEFAKFGLRQVQPSNRSHS